jgi:hypothetical protein
MVGAIHGRLLTAWSVAGIVGPVLVNYLREYQLAHGVERARVYDLTLYILGASLLAGLACNLLVRPVAARHHMTEEEILATRASAPLTSLEPAAKTPPGAEIRVRREPLLLVGAWLAVALPLLWGVLTTLERASVLLPR